MTRHPPLREFTSVPAFATSAEPGWLRGRVFVRWRLERGLRGYFVWGRPTASDARAMVDVFEAEPPAADRYLASVADYRELEHVDPQAFAVLAAHVERESGDGGPALEAVLRPGGVCGAVIAGFFALVQPTRRVALFTELAEALRWVGRPEVDPVLARLRASTREDVADDPLLRRLRKALAAHVGRRDSLHAAATRLSLSPRTLQYHLQRAGTSFRRERDRVRLAAAQRLMRETDTPLSAIAVDVGFATPQHFSEWFRRATGSSPSRWRSGLPEPG